MFTISWSLLKLTSIESVMPSNHLTLCHPLLLLPSIFPSVRVFSNESALHRGPKYWSFSFSMSPSSEYSGPISFRMDWLDLLAVQGTLKSLLQPHSLKASLLWHSAFFMVQYFIRPFMRKVCAGQGAVYSHVSWGFLPSPMPDPQAGEHDIGLRTLTSMGELLQYNYSPACVLPT